MITNWRLKANFVVYSKGYLLQNQIINAGHFLTETADVTEFMTRRITGSPVESNRSSNSALQLFFLLLDLSLKRTNRN